MELVIRTRDSSAIPSSLPVEVVERKGLGHPDTICDAIAEHVCVRLCNYYLDRFGTILHHNVDKVLLCGGSARPDFGGGEVLEAIEIYLAGRATQEFRGAQIPVHDIAIDAARDWIRSSITGLDVDSHVRIVSRLRPGSRALTSLLAGTRECPSANDTSCGVGFAPLTDLERVVLAVEQVLNGPETKRSHPEIGTDIKVMGVRHEQRIQLTIGCAFVDRFVSNLDDYARKKAAAGALAVAAARTETALDVDAIVNAGDNMARGDVYLTVTGTSAEAGDDGEVGRGNRTSGLITPYRTMSIEAAAGKNPVNHVGKLYNLVAGRIATSLTTDLRGVQDATCLMVSQIGHPVTDPQIVDIALAASDDSAPARRRAAVAHIVRAHLDRMDTLHEDLIAGRLSLY